MKNKAVMFVFLLCVTIFLTGCELPWGDCGPAELSKRVPLGVTFAKEIALSHRGVITGLVQAGELSCNDIQSITYGPAYQEVIFNTNVPSASSEDIFIFQNKYVAELYCREQFIGGVEIGKLFGIWLMVGVTVSGGPFEALEALENYLGPDFTDCTRGLIMDVRFGIVCAIITDKQGITRFYPLYPDNPIWGNTEGKEIGEFSLTKEEFFEWYHNNIDLDS